MLPALNGDITRYGRDDPVQRTVEQAHIENLKAELAAKGELATTVACTHARTP